MQSAQVPYQYAGGLNPLPRGKVPSTMRYETKQPAVQCTFNRVEVQPSSGTTFGPGATLAFDLPVQPGTYLANKMSYISFKLTPAADTRQAKPAYGGVSVFEKMQIFHAGNMLEQISGNYNDLVSIMMNIKCQDDNMNNVQRLLNGTGLRRYIETTNAGTTPEALATVKDDPSLQILVTDVFDGTDPTPAGSLANSYYVHQPFSGLLGADVDKFCPLGFLSRGGELRVEFQLASVFKAFHGTTMTDYVISDVKYNCFIITLDPLADSLIRQNLGETCVLSSKTYLVANSTVAAQSSGVSVILPYRVSSLCALYFAMIPSSAKTSLAAPAIGRYNKNNLAYYDISIGGFRYPNAPIYCDTDSNKQALGFAELLNSISGLASTNLGLGIPAQNYVQDAATFTEDDDARPMFIGGINTEAFHPYTESLISGMDTLQRQMQLNLTFDSDLSLNDTYDLLIFGLIDTAFYIDMINGVMRSSV